MKRPRSSSVATAVKVGEMEGDTAKQRRTNARTAALGVTRRGDEAPDVVELGEKGAPSKSEMRGGVYHPQTGALARKFETFQPDEKPRGYGVTRVLDDHPFLRPHISIAVGPTGSGKTTVLLNELAETLANIHPKRLGKVMVYSGSPQDDLLKRLDPEVIDFYGPEQKEGLLAALRQLHQDSLGDTSERDKPLNILVLDDAGTSGDLMPTQTKNTEVGETFVRHRHLPLSILAAAQRFQLANKFLRQNATHLYVFPSRAKGEAEDVLKNVNLPEDVLLKTMRAVSTNPHQFLWLDLLNKTGKIGFNRVFVQ